MSTLGLVSQGVKQRYDSSRRRASAEATRTRVLQAARELFVNRGFAATSVADIAKLAGVSVDTLYATVGRKPQLLLAVHDMELAGGGEPVDADERDYVKRMRAASTAAEKIAIYAESLSRVLPTAAPLLSSLKDAGVRDQACAVVHQAIVERRARNMSRLASELRATGDLRADVDDDFAARLLWSMNDADYFLALRSRGVTPAQYASLVRKVWTRTLLRRDVLDAADDVSDRLSP